MPHGLDNTDGRERVADRLLRSSAEHFYDADVDIDWAAPWEEGKHWLPEHRLSLYGTELWRRLTPEQRVELGKHELVSLLSFGILAEGLLSKYLLRIVAREPATRHAMYALTEIGEESRHSTMFARLIDKTGVAPYRPNRLNRIQLKLAEFFPLGPVVYAGTLLIEEILDRGQRETMADSTIQPHVRQLMRIHVLEEARHIGFARDELARGMAERGAARRLPHQLLLAYFGLVVYPMLINPKVYESVGIEPWRGFLAAFTGPQYRATMRFLSEPMLRYFAEVGLLDGKVVHALWQLARSLPDDL
ncbi:diiron oxygenase [Nocardia sp. BMG51109]|uniref:AurF N-oxygenase family protein n=1 Tax=Nocardia sp. BMG51109 TaxID=1056816 RepID=UPI000466D520|nr:diiron oxygenase [Nocardia sp. BMG51109]